MEKPAYNLEFEKPLRELSRRLDELRQQSLETNVDLTAQIAGIEKDISAAQREIYSNLTPWQKVQIARHPKRPYALDYLGLIFEGFEELHGDRCFDPAHQLAHTIATEYEHLAEITEDNELLYRQAGKYRRVENNWKD